MADSNPLALCVKIALRVILVLLNISYLLVSVGIIGCGIFTVVNKDDLGILVGKSVTVVSVVIIIVGVALLVTSILGIIGAIGNFWPVLSVYSFFIFILICGQVTVTVLAFVGRDKVESQVSKQMLEYIKNYTTSTSTSTSHNEESNAIIDVIQITFQCCGRDGPGDWVRYNFKYITSNNGFPESCACGDVDGYYNSNDDDRCFTFPGYTVGVWKKGCNETVVNFIEKNLKVFGGVAAASGAITILTFLLSIGLVVLNLAEVQRNRRYTRLQNGATGSSLQEITYAADPGSSQWNSHVV